MSALHRLADPLTGHDSMEALAPQARRRREERIKRVSPTGGRRGKHQACQLYREDLVSRGFSTRSTKMMTC